MSLPAPAVAPNVPTYATFTPYITAAEFKASATGVDVTQLVPGGTSAENAAALVTKIARASSYADNLCHKVLAATLDTQSGCYRLRPDGTIRVPLDNTPIIAVVSVSLGYRAGQLTPLGDLSGIGFRKKSIAIPVTGLSLGGTAGPGVPARAGQVFATVQYVNGWANTTLTAPAAAGDLSVTVAQPLGMFPGLPVQLYDGASTEPAVVSAAYVQGSATVPLAAPLGFAHTAGVAVSALPPFVKEAVVLLTTALIKTRGAESVVMGAMEAEPEKAEKIEAGGLEEFDLAVDLLSPLMRVA